MKRNRIPGKREEGYALAGAVILVFAMILIGLAFFAVAGYETRQSQQDLASQRAFWLAEAGKERALLWMTGQPRPPEGDITIFTDQAGPGGGSYTVHCVVDTSTVYAATKGFVLDCTGTSGNRHRRIRQRIQMISFAQYGYFTDGEQPPGGGPIWFQTTDVLAGRTHSNGVFHILGSPTFLGPVTSAADHMVGSPSYNVYGPEGWPVGGNNPNFTEGFELNVPNIPLPTQTSDLKEKAQFEGGLFLPNATTIEFGVDVNGNPAPGFFRYRNTPPPPNSPWTAVAFSSLSSHVIYSNNDVEVSGIVSGSLTVGCNKNIWIMNDIRYLNSDLQGTPFPGCRDMLGLVAEDNISFKNNAPNQSDLRIDAVMMALNTSISAEQYGQGVPRGTLTIWGGLIQKYRGAVGTVQSGAVVTGYRKDYHYDPRVTGYTPPAFPLTGVYEKVAWSETWDGSYPF